jgi:Tfp pilus assembly PilM family ATPase
MPDLILGLDIGDTSVKALLAAGKGLADARVLAFETVSLGGDVGLDAALKKIAEALRPQMSSGVRCIVSLPPADVMFRHITLPFRDDNKIRKTLPFELESVLPVPIEEVIVDYVPMPAGGLLAAACDKVKIGRIIAAVEANLGPVAAIDIAAAALALPILDRKTTQAAGLVLDVGALSTVAVFYENNAIIQIRSFDFGGDAITRGLAQDLSCEPQEAEQIKIHASYGTLIDHTREVCRQFCSDLQNTIEFLKLHETLHVSVTQVTISGGGSMFLPLDDSLEKALGVPVDHLDLLGSGKSEIDEKLKNTYMPQVINTVLATVRRALTSRKSFNFRQGEFATKNILGDFRTQLKWGAILAGIIILLAVVDQVLDYRLQSQKASVLKNQISQVFIKHFSPTAVMVDPVAQLRNKLAEDKKTYGIDSGSSSTSVIGLLKEISGLIPPSLDIVVTHFHYENNKVLVRGEAKKIDDITGVKNELLKSKLFKTVTIGSTALGKEGSRVDFDLRMELQ